MSASLAAIAVGLGLAFQAPAAHRAAGSPRAAGVRATVATPAGLGTASDTDESAFVADPRGFCRLRAGTSFATGAFGGSVFVGDADGIALAGAAPAAPRRPADLDAPFAWVLCDDGADPFAEHSESFNAEVYATLFEWIPQYKEAGFSTFRFSDFIDSRVRKVLPSARRLFLRAASPALLGAPYAELPSLTGCENGELQLDYGAHASQLRASTGGSALAAAAAVAANLASGVFSKLPILADGAVLLGGEVAGGGNPAALKSALERAARGGGGGAAGGAADGAAALAGLTASVEQMSALLCSMLSMAQAHPAWAKALADEQSAALKGLEPTAPITAEVLGSMPLLQAFTLETLRLHPPSRPWCATLGEGATLRGAALPAGTVLAPEPFVAHLDPAAYDNPAAFDPSRFSERGAPPPQLGFGGALGASPSAGARLATSMTQAAYVQLRRMFDETTLGAQPPPLPAGYSLHTLAEDTEVRLVAKMFYELQRGVKKLKF